MPALQGSCNKAFSAGDGFHEAEPMGEKSGDGGGERASSSVGDRLVDATRAETRAS
jgi:hypothetical protein